MNLHQELSELQTYLDALESPTMELHKSGADIKPREIVSVKREIASLEAALAATAQ